MNVFKNLLLFVTICASGAICGMDVKQEVCIESPVPYDLHMAKLSVIRARDFESLPRLSKVFNKELRKLETQQSKNESKKYKTK